MNNDTTERITTSQATFVIVNYAVAAGVLTLPRILVQIGKTPDVWISVIIGGLLSFLAGYLIIRLGRRFPGQTFYQYCSKIVGRPIALFIGLAIVVYFTCIASYELRSVQEITTFFLLEGTPGWTITAVILWVAVYLCIGGINALARMCRLIVPITWVVFFGAGLLSMEMFDLENLRPVLADGLGPVLRAVKPTALTFTAGEDLLFLVALMAKPQKAGKAFAVGTAIATFFYVTSVVISIGVFSTDGVVTRTWPFLDVVRSYEVSYLFFERFEPLMLAIWIIQIFCCICITLYGAAIGLSHLFQLNYRYSLFALLPFVHILKEIPHTINGLFAFGTILGDCAMLMFGIVPLVLLVIAKLRKISA
ncbi:GerAB/ArcD/ProY family transporter [Gorillibacterium timonense]|uniref:GerAB/ArcD/ProY family transporter n=1 Tax=Gorillibacterium timonense TaxID=1689269 RepID=UPI00071D0B2E|nr:GerAB/ArcD/ProY family transporter [Gorillibacterium timonense]